jgi:hypothetical protein
MVNDPEHGADALGAALRGDPGPLGDRGRLFLSAALGSLILGYGEAYLKD